MAVRAINRACKPAAADVSGRRWLQAPVRATQRYAFMLCAALMLTANALAQDYPSKPVVMIVPFPPGGSTDILARLLAEPMRAALGQPVVVQNVTGAGATIGVARAVQAPADGYTLSIGNWTSHVGGPVVYRVPWHVVNDLEPVAPLTVTSLVIVGRTGLPVNNAKEFIAWLKANPDHATAATVGAGSGAHVCAIYFGQKTGTSFRYVPYRGGGPVMADLLSNQVDFFCGEASQMLGHFQSGKIKPLIVMSKNRWRPLPDIPTMAEAGASDTYITFWNGLWAPKGTPKPIIAKLNDAVGRAFADATVIKRLTEFGQEIPARDQLAPEILGALHKSEIDKWWPLIKAANIKIE